MKIKYCKFYSALKVKLVVFFGFMIFEKFVLLFFLFSFRVRMYFLDG